MSADLLRRAAAKLRDNARSIAHFGHAWTLQPGDDGDWQILYVQDDPDAGLLATIPDYAGMDVGDWITLMSPALAEPLAAALDWAADEERQNVEWRAPRYRVDLSALIDLARVILGEVEPS